jgi:beta-galactosidase
MQTRSSMRTLKFIFISLAIFLFAFQPFCFRAYAQEKDRSILFDDGWRFYRGGAQGAENNNFDDSKWRQIDLPHDWSIEDLPGKNTPFSRDAISQVSGGFTTGGTGWYRKTFTLPPASQGKRVLLIFDGVYMNAECWLNGKPLGSHPYGYTSFCFDITSQLKPNGENLLAVKVKNEGENSRWYSGSGIYRHVWLNILNPVHVAQWGTTINTTQVDASQARLKIKTRLINESGQPSVVTVINRCMDPSNREVARTETVVNIPSLKDSGIIQDLVINNPLLWSTDEPSLYKAITELRMNGESLDRTETNFGIRSLSFDAVNGFRLNGVPMKLKGGCVHHDNGPLGSKAYDRAEERRVQILKQNGYNAIRCAHNPPSPAFLDACDRLGMLVIDEAFDMWREGKNPYDYHLYFDNWWKKDVESMVLSDRNHPSVILWSIGNEIPERGTPAGASTAQMLVNFIKSMDSTRPVTSAVNGLNPDKDPYFATLDVAGYNYAYGGDHQKKSLHEEDHLRVPQRVIIGTESYPLEAYGAWKEVEDHPYVVGDFVWTAFDYIGEASIGWRGYYQYQDFFPWNLAYCGDIDICGWKRPQSFYRDALWKKDQLSIFIKPPRPSFEENPARESWSKWHWSDAVADWNWTEKGRPMEVNVYSSCDEVELLLNGQSLGKKLTDKANRNLATWQVPYQPGSLQAIGFSHGQQVNKSELKTTDKPVKIKLTADRTSIAANGEDLSYVEVELLDQNNLRYPKAENLLRFEISGPGTIVGVGNANPVSLESYQRPQRKAWQGRALVIIKSNHTAGKITLRALSAGLKTASVEISSK